MPEFLRWPNAVLTWIGGRGSSGLVATVVIGVAFPSLGTTLKPYVFESVLVLLFLAFLRVGSFDLRSQASRPTLVVLAVVWTMFVSPILLCLVYRLLGPEILAADLSLVLVLQASAPPMMSTPAIAALLGLDSTLVLVAMIACTAIAPLTAPFFVSEFAGLTVNISPLVLGLKLFGLLAGTALSANIVKRQIGRERIVRNAALFDGLNVIVMFIFFVTLFSNAGDHFYRHPLLVVEYTALAFLLTLVLSGTTAILLARYGWDRALGLGLLASQRNMALMLAAVGTLLSDNAWLYFALAQLPLYLLPATLLPVLRKIKKT